MSTELAVVTASTKLSAFLGMDKSMMLDTIKAQCFKNKHPDEVSDTQLAAFVSVAALLELNPLIPGFLYAYPEKNGGITPIVGPDGTFKKLSELKGVSYQCDVFPDDVTAKPTHAVAQIFVDGKEHPHKYTARFSEWCVGSNPNWQTRPAHMLWLRAIKQCARQVIHGLPMDEDERHIAGLVNVTNTGDQSDAPTPVRQTPPKRARGVAAAAAEKETASETATTTVEAEIVPPATETKAAEQTKAVTVEVVTEVAAAPVVEKKPEAKPAPAPEKKPDAPKETPKQPTAAAVTKLADGQRITFERLEVVEFAKKAINKQPSIEAELKGAFTGKVYHIGGAESAAWQLDKPVNVTLIGKKLTSGAVISLVEKLEVSSEGDALELS